MTIKTNKEIIDYIVNCHQAEHLSPARIAEALQKKYGASMTRQGIYKILKKFGVGTSDESVRVVKFCDQCGKKLSVTRSRLRGKPNKHSFCSIECYHKWLHNGNHVDSHRGTREARKIISKIYGKIPAGAIVHHVDGNELNNNISNLVLFRNQNDHLQHHRDTASVEPLFIGSDILLPSSTACKKYSAMICEILTATNSWEEVPETKAQIMERSMSLATAVRLALKYAKPIVGPKAVRGIFLSLATNRNERTALERLFEDPTVY